jgi:hypothetical protein
VSLAALVTASENAPAVRVLAVQGTELTGLNGPALVDTVRGIRDSGVTAVVLDLAQVTRVTPEGAAALSEAARLFGAGRFALANVGEQPAGAVSADLEVFPSVDDAVAGLGRPASLPDE